MTEPGQPETCASCAGVVAAFKTAAKAQEELSGMETWPKTLHDKYYFRIEGLVNGDLTHTKKRLSWKNEELDGRCPKELGIGSCALQTLMNEHFPQPEIQGPSTTAAN